MRAGENSWFMPGRSIEIAVSSLAKRFGNYREPLLQTADLMAS